MAAGKASADSVDEVNSDVLPSGTFKYATVTVIQSGVDTVQFTVDPDKTCSCYTSTGPNFGAANFGFNTDLSLSTSDFKSLPAGWRIIQNGSCGGFGNVNWVVLSNLQQGQDPLVFKVVHSGATPAHFEFKNTQKAEFTTHIVHFTTLSGVTSQWVANKEAVPNIFFRKHILLLATLMAILCFLILVICLIKRKRKRAASTL
jgi:hypothetical protein